MNIGEHGYHKLLMRRNSTIGYFSNSWAS